MKEFDNSPISTPARFYLAGVAVVVICLSCFRRPHAPPFNVLFMLVFMLGEYLVRHVLSYRITPERVIIHRRLWDVSLPKNRLLTATLDTQVFNDRPWSLLNSRTAWMHTGRYSTPRLGAFQAFVTDPHHAVVLRFKDQTVVVSPQDPRAFMKALNVPADSDSGLQPVPSSSGGGYLSGYW